MQYPVVDMKATGEKIRTLRESRGLTVKQLQEYFGFEEPQAIYKWQRGENLPNLQNLIMLTSILGLDTIEDILVIRDSGD